MFFIQCFCYKLWHFIKYTCVLSFKMSKSDKILKDKFYEIYNWIWSQIQEFWICLEYRKHYLNPITISSIEQMVE